MPNSMPALPAAALLCAARDGQGIAAQPLPGGSRHLDEELIDHRGEPWKTGIARQPLAPPMAGIARGRDDQDLALLRQDDPDDRHAGLEVPARLLPQLAFALVAARHLDGQRRRCAPGAALVGARVGTAPTRRSGAVRTWDPTRAAS